MASVSDALDFADDRMALILIKFQADLGSVSSVAEARARGEVTRMSLRTVRKAVREDVEELSRSGSLARADLAGVQKQIEKLVKEHGDAVMKLVTAKEANLLAL